MKRLEIFIRRILLLLILLIKRKPNRLPLPTFDRKSKILFIRLNRIGDALVTTPLLFEIKKQIGCKVFVLASSSNYFIFENPKLTDEIIVYRKNINGIFSLIKMINEIGFDAMVDLHDDVSSTVSYITAFVKVNYKFGLYKRNAKLFTHTVEKLDPTKHHVVDRMMEFSKLFNLKIDFSKVNIVYDATAEVSMKADLFLEKHYTNQKFLLGINISAGSNARFWGKHNYKQLIAELSGYDVNLLLMCAEKDLKSAVEIAEGKVPIFYRPDFNQFCAMIQKLDFLVTPDTSVVHVASAFTKPLFGIYVKYNTADKIWSPYRSPFECVVTEEATIENVSYESVKKKFFPFFEKYYYGYKSQNL